MKKLLLILSVFLLFAQAQGQSVIRAQSNARAIATSGGASTLLTGLVAYWTMDEASGNMTSEVGDTYGTTTDITYGIAGKLGDCYQFNNSSSLVSVVDVGSVLQLNTLTISFWMKEDGNNDRLLEYYASSQGWTIGTSSSGYLSWFIRAATANENLDDVDITDDAWHHVVCTYDGAHMILYIDGEEEVSEERTGGITYVGAAFTIGTNAGANDYGGLMDEVCIYNRALGQSGVDSLWNAGNGLAYPF